MLTRSVGATALALFAFSASGCTALGGSLLVGGPHAPQQDLVARVRGAEREMQEARADFAAACLAYQRLTAPQAIDLGRLSGEFEDSVETCDDRARDLAERIDAVREEKEALAKSWTEELARFSSDAVRAKSEAQMRDTEARAQRLLAALERLQGRMKTVLLKFQDYALFFDHNLHARAIATLQDTYKDFDKEFKNFESELSKAQGEIEDFLAYFVAPAPAEPAG
jgi:DNA repair exonuclease SbcCD ATPase subunit